MVGWHQGAPMGQQSTRSAEDMYPKGDGRHRFRLLGSMGSFQMKPKGAWHPAWWWVSVSGQKLGMCLLPVVRVKNIWGYLWPFLHIPAALGQKESHPSCSLLGSSTCCASGIDPQKETHHLLCGAGGPGSCLLGWQIFECPLHLQPGVELHGCTALSGVTLRCCEGAIKGFCSIFSTHCGTSSLEILDLMAESLPGSSMAVCEALGRM